MAPLTEPGPIHRYLSADHARLNGLLLAALPPTGGIDPAPYREFKEGILRHIGMEERVLMPATHEARAGNPLPVERRLRIDHHAIALLTVPTPTREGLGTIADILAPHNVLEEEPEGFYVLCERLAGEGVDTLFARMLAFPHLPLAPHADTPEVAASVTRALEERRAFLSSGS